MIGFVIFIVIFVGIIALVLGAYLIGFAGGKARRKKYQGYILQQFPHLQGQDFLMAKQLSMKLKPSIALIIEPTRNDLILLFETENKGVTHLVYPAASLGAVTRSAQILTRGGTNSYEETLALTFSDNNTYRFIVENISNLYGNDKGADFIRNIMNPWEERLRALLPANPQPPAATG
jgi:hypothetical protein